MSNRYREVFVTDTPAPCGRLARATIHRIASPGYSVCMRCGAPWNHADLHSTPVGTSGGCFPLCELCWSELSPEQRLPYYKHLMWLWRDGGSEPDSGYEEMLFLSVMRGL